MTVEEAALSSEGTAGPSMGELGGRKILGGIYWLVWGKFLKFSELRVSELINTDSTL